MWFTRALQLAAVAVVSIVPLAAQDSSAKVIYQVGQVSLSSGGYFKVLNVGDKIAARQLIVTGPDGYARFEVADHSTFEVFPNSRVVFRETPGNWEHLLNVFLGHVKVFIQHAPGVANPNNVTSPIAVISVRGTVFDVLVQDPDTTFVTLEEGIVDVKNETAAGNVATLKPGDSITIYRGQPLFAQAIDKGAILRKVLYAARDAYYRVMVQRGPGGVGAPIPGGAGGAQGDKGKPPVNNPAPGAPPAGPGAPPAGPGAPPAVPGAPPAGPGGGE
jgi:hypothetical protein